MLALLLLDRPRKPVGPEDDMLFGSRAGSFQGVEEVYARCPEFENREKAQPNTGVLSNVFQSISGVPPSLVISSIDLANAARRRDTPALS